MGEIGPMVLGSFKFNNVFSLYGYHSFVKRVSPPLWRRVWLLWTNMNPLSLQIFCHIFVPNFVDIGSVVLKNVKRLQTDKQTEGRQLIKKAHFSFKLSWAKEGTIYQSPLTLLQMCWLSQHLEMWLQKC